MKTTCNILILSALLLFSSLGVAPESGRWICSSEDISPDAEANAYFFDQANQEYHCNYESVVTNTAAASDDLPICACENNGSPDCRPRANCK